MYVLQTYVHLCYLWRILLSFKYCIKNYLFLSVNVAFWLKYNSCISPFLRYVSICIIRASYISCSALFDFWSISVKCHVVFFLGEETWIHFSWTWLVNFALHKFDAIFIPALWSKHYDSSQNPSLTITQLFFNRGWQLQALRLLRSRCHNNRNEWIWRLLYSRLWWPLGYSHSRRCYRMCF